MIVTFIATSIITSFSLVVVVLSPVDFFTLSSVSTEMPVKASLFSISLLTCLTSLQTSDNNWQSDIRSAILFLMGILVKPCTKFQPY